MHEGGNDVWLWVHGYNESRGIYIPGSGRSKDVEVKKNNGNRDNIHEWGEKTWAVLMKGSVCNNEVGTMKEVAYYQVYISKKGDKQYNVTARTIMWVIYQ